MLVISKQVADALRMMERAILVASVHQSDFPISDRSNAGLSLFIDQDEAVIASVRNHEQVMIEVLLLFDA